MGLFSCKINLKTFPADIFLLAFIINKLSLQIIYDLDNAFIINN